MRTPCLEDLLSKKMIDRQDRVQCAKSKASKNQQSTQKLSQASAGEAMSKLQQQDSDIGPILRLRIQQINQPRPKEVLSESEMTKVLWGLQSSNWTSDLFSTYSYIFNVN